MTRIAAAEGFATQQILTEQATNVLAAIRDAARQLAADETFLITYAGHGGQVPNDNSDVEDDQQDETWVLYDRQMRDDELWTALAAFAAGMKVVLVSDSCHSGSVRRSMEDPIQWDITELKRSFYTDLAVPRRGPGSESAAAAFPRPVNAVRAMQPRADRGWRPAASGDGDDRTDADRPIRFPGQRSRVDPPSSNAMMKRSPNRSRMPPSPHGKCRCKST
jgi:uncharacterized caspase-like protein